MTAIGANTYELLRRGVRKVREEGFFNTVRLAAIRLIDTRPPEPPPDVLPLSRADHKLLFAVNEEDIRLEQRAKMRATAMVFEASHVEATYPLIFEWNCRFLRYAYVPARQHSKGLVVLFHGHNAYLHLGPMNAWNDFDLLAPWDTFGWHRQGSWFWGQKGDNFVELMMRDLIQTYRNQKPEHPWFCLGASMGGFGALYHGIKYQCDGIYAIAPQVDLCAKIREYEQKATPDNPYSFLQGEPLDSVPDLLTVAESQEELPPLFLVQHQYDPVNYFAEHAFRLLDVYNRKQAWYGVRVYPAIGHTGDGSSEEAQVFFSLILEKHPPKHVNFSSYETTWI